MPTITPERLRQNTSANDINKAINFFNETLQAGIPNVKMFGGGDVDGRSIAPAASRMVELADRYDAAAAPLEQPGATPKELANAQFIHSTAASLRQQGTTALAELSAADARLDATSPESRFSTADDSVRGPAGVSAQPVPSQTLQPEAPKTSPAPASSLEKILSGISDKKTPETLDKIAYRGSGRALPSGA